MDVAVNGEERAVRPSSGSFLGRGGLTDADALTGCLVGVYTIAWSTRFVSADVPRLAILLCSAPVAFWTLVAAVRRREAASIALGSLLTVLLVAGLLSPDPLMSVRGDIASWMSVAAYVLAATWWVLGRMLSPAGRTLVPIVLSCGAGINAAVGLAQVGLDVTSGPLASVPGRASGLLQNPVYYGSFMVGVCAYWTVRSVQARRWSVLAVVFGSSLASGLSGSRIVLAVAIAVALAASVHKRAWSGCLTLAVVALGFVAAAAFSRATASVSTIDRIAGGESIESRLHIWRNGLAAFRERPVLGWGPNHFGTATTRRLSASYVRDFAYDDAVQSWADPHNALILTLVTVGVLGLAALATFLVLASRGVREAPLFAAAIAIALTWILQPATLHSLPVALLLLGAAVRPAPAHALPHVDLKSQTSPPRPVTTSARSLSRPTFIALFTVGASIGAALLVSTFLIDAAGRASDPPTIERRAALFDSDPAVQNYVSHRLEAAAVGGSVDDSQQLLARAIRASRRAATTFPSPRRWNRVAELHLLAGDLAAARTATDHALDLQPWNPTGHRRLYLIARLTEDAELRQQAEANVCLLELDVCPSSTD